MINLVGYSFTINGPWCQS